MLEFLVLIISLPFLLLVCSWIKNYQYWKYIMEIPGPKSYPLIGTMLSIVFDTENLFYHERRRIKKYYPIFRHWSFNISFVSIISADDIELVLSNTKHNQKSRLYDFLRDWLGSGLLTSFGNKWQTRRKILTPAFHFSILQGFISIFNRETENLVKILEKNCDRPHIDVVKPVTDYTLCAIGETSLSLNLNKGHDSYKEAVHAFGDIAARRVVKPWLHNHFFFSLTPLFRGHRKAVEVLHEFSTTIVQERKKIFLESQELSNPVKKRLAMLDLLLKAEHNGADIDDEGIREEVDTFIFEGHDTASMGMCFTLMQLASEEKIQEQILQEIEEILGDSDRLPTYEDLVEMKFMERCIKECLRLYPSVPFIGRVAGEDIKTRSGYTIPKGCDIVIYIFDLHRSSQYWEDPEKFDPDRFLPENIAKRHPFAYLPFSAGSRNCIGQKYVLLEIKSVLCGILRKFKLKPIDTPQKIKFKSDLVLRPLDQIRVKFEMRK
nr:cytochrome P450 [Pharsalia antennata]